MDFADRVGFAAVWCQENGPAEAEEGKAAGADKNKESGGGSSSRSKSTTHFTPDELQAILQVGCFRPINILHASP